MAQAFTYHTSRPARQWMEQLFLAGLTAVFLSTFTVWLPGPGAGLQLVGLEMGEWTKFIGLGVERNWFYWPPVVLSLVLLLWTVQWTNGRWQTWFLRGVAVLISVLVFPAIADVTGFSREQYMGRVYWIGLVGLTAVIVSLWSWKPRLPWLSWVVIAGLALSGLILPTQIYLQVQPHMSQTLNIPLGIGLGVWLNGVGQLLILIYAFWQLKQSQHFFHR